MLDQIISNPLAIGFIVLAAITLAMAIVVLLMHRKMQRFLIGIDAKNIQDSLTFMGNDLESFKRFRKEMEAYLSDAEKRLRKSIQAVETVRFNPFKGDGSGGDQSFATAFLSEEGNGVVISGLYSRDHISVYSKPVSNGSSLHELSDEEKSALQNAKSKL